MTLDQLSADASGGTWHHNNGGVTGNPWISTDNWTRENGEYVRGGCILNMVAHDKRQQDAAFIVALVNAYRTGQLVAVADDAIERVFKALKSCPLWHDIDGDATIADFHIDDDMLVMLSTAAFAAMKDTQL